jgi:hypothetical protein
MSTTIRVSEATRDRLAAFAHADHRPMTSVLDEALDALERRRFFVSFNDRYAQLRVDADDWAAIENERALESAPLADTAT